MAKSECFSAHRETPGASAIDRHDLVARLHPTGYDKWVASCPDQPPQQFILSVLLLPVRHEDCTGHTGVRSQFGHVGSEVSQAAPQLKRAAAEEPEKRKIRRMLRRPDDRS